MRVGPHADVTHPVSLIGTITGTEWSARHLISPAEHQLATMSPNRYCERDGTVSTLAKACPHGGAPLGMTENHEHSQEIDQERKRPKSDLETSYRVFVVISTLLAYGFFYLGWSRLFWEGEWEPMNTWLFSLGTTVIYYLGSDLVRRELGGDRTRVPYIIGFCILAACVVAIFVYDIRFQQPAWDASEATKDVFKIQNEYPTAKNFRTAAGFLMINGLVGGALGALVGIAAARMLLCWKGR